jgi:hypothetical protein
MQWTTKTGKRIRVSDMTDEHIDRAIAMLDRFRAKVCGNLYRIADMVQGEMAQVLIEDLIYRAEENPEGIMGFWPEKDIYWRLVRERERRDRANAKQPVFEFELQSSIA